MLMMHYKLFMSLLWKDAKSFIHLDVNAGTYSKLSDTVNILLAEETLNDQADGIKVGTM